MILLFYLFYIMILFLIIDPLWSVRIGGIHGGEKPEYEGQAGSCFSWLVFLLSRLVELQGRYLPPPLLLGVIH